MKLRNKKTGEIAVIRETIHLTKENDICCGMGSYNSLAELNAEWEDVPEEQCYYINSTGEVREGILDVDWRDERRIGNFFKTKEEAEKAVKKLKAWKRLKDKGFRFELWDYDGGNYQERISTGRVLFRVKEYEENDKDLDLLFGGEE